MTHPAVEWTLDQVASVVTSVENDYSLSNGDDVNVRRVDRDASRLYDGDGTIDMSSPIRKRTDQLSRGVYIGAAYVDRDEEPIGTEFDLDIDTVVGVRLEGMTANGGPHGHVDEDGTDGVPWGEFHKRVRRAIYDGRTYPDAGRANEDFTHLTLTNHAPQSALWADYYRYDFDVMFDGFEEL